MLVKQKYWIIFNKLEEVLVKKRSQRKKWLFKILLVDKIIVNIFVFFVFFIISMVENFLELIKCSIEWNNFSK